MTSLGKVNEPRNQGKWKNTALVLLTLSVVIIMLGGVGITATYYLFFHQSSEDTLVTGMAVAQVTTTTTTTTTSTSTTTSTTSTTTSTKRSTTRVTTTTVAPTCTDGIKNQGEDEVDCGGPCDPCETPVVDIAQCISSKGVKLYMRDDDICRKCKSINEYFGSLISLFDVIDCERSSNKDECNDMLEEAEDQGKPRGYPTWEINGEMYPGYSLKAIRTETGCL